MWKNTYTHKRVLITGHTGFKGSWLTLWLKSLGAEICGYSLAPDTSPSLFETARVAEGITSVLGDVSDTALLRKTFASFQPEIVFHLAAQPLVRRSYQHPVLTYQTNVMGTLHVLEAARKCGHVKAFVNVTTDKCYENKETTHLYQEDDPMGGYDPYSSSKGCVELLSASYRRSFLQEPGAYALATARAGNVIGGGDWAPDRLIPDCVRHIETNTPIELRYPHATRPWEYVLEPLSGYLLLGHKLLESGSAYAEGFNFGPSAQETFTVEEMTHRFIRAYGKGTLTTPSRATLHEASLLQLNTDKAHRVLGWQPTYSADEAIAHTAQWYKRFYEGKTDMHTFTLQQIHQYQEKIVWKKN